jgi:predicted house-cleaning noncanonical NTP pyrophosphatase (MazG superfamily)
MMQRYDKLVRDGIPDIIRSKGGTPVTHVATQSEYGRALRAKLQEEVGEFLASNETEELADILEVVYALGELHGFRPENLDAIRDRKVELRGGFSGRIILEEA